MQKTNGFVSKNAQNGFSFIQFPNGNSGLNPQKGQKEVGKNTAWGKIKNERRNLFTAKLENAVARCGEHFVRLRTFSHWQRGK